MNRITRIILISLSTALFAISLFTDWLIIELITNAISKSTATITVSGLRGYISPGIPARLELWTIPAISILSCVSLLLNEFERIRIPILIPSILLAIPAVYVAYCLTLAGHENTQVASGPFIAMLASLLAMWTILKAQMKQSQNQEVQPRPFSRSAHSGRE